MTARFSLSLVCLLTICAANSFGQYIDNQINNQPPAAQSATAWITGEYRTNAAFRLTREGADIIQTGLIMKNTANDKGVNLQLTGDAVPGLGIWIVSSTGAWNERMRITESGDVGIGTSSPLNSTNNAGLHISKGNHSTIVLGDPFNGYGGFMQTSDNKHRVFIGANFYDDVAGSWKVAQSGKGVAGISIIADEGAFGTAIDFVTSSGSTYNRSMSIVGNGNVGIGTMTPQAKLAVNGDVFAKKVKVTQSGWPDYVFAEDYKLPPLAELENYIKAHQHLPDMPTATEVENEGLDLGEMNKKLLQKVEELTLYLIQVNKQNQELKAEIEMLKSRIK